jgi:hypothetical protein
MVWVPGDEQGWMERARERDGADRGRAGARKAAGDGRVFAHWLGFSAEAGGHRSSSTVEPR